MNNFEIKSLRTCIFTQQIYGCWRFWILRVFSRLAGKLQEVLVGLVTVCITNCKQDFMMWSFSFVSVYNYQFPSEHTFTQVCSALVCFLFGHLKIFPLLIFFYPLVIWCCLDLLVFVCVKLSNFFSDFWLYPIAMERLNFLSIFASAYIPARGERSRKMRCCLS